MFYLLTKYKLASIVKYPFVKIIYWFALFSLKYDTALLWLYTKLHYLIITQFEVLVIS